MRRIIALFSLLPTLAQAELRVGALAESTPLVVSDVIADGHYRAPEGPGIGAAAQVGWRFGESFELGVGLDWSAELSAEGRSLHLVRVPVQVSWVVPLESTEFMLTGELGYVGGSAVRQGDDGDDVGVSGLTAGVLLGLGVPVGAGFDLLFQSGLRASIFEGKAVDGYFDGARGMQFSMPFRVGVSYRF